jgi:hypothetical protein
MPAASVPSRGEKMKERAHEIVLGLPGEAHDDVGGDGEVGHEAARLGEPVQVPGAGVATVHEREHPVRA